MGGNGITIGIESLLTVFLGVIAFGLSAWLGAGRAMNGKMDRLRNEVQQQHIQAAEARSLLLERIDQLVQQLRADEGRWRDLSESEVLHRRTGILLTAADHEAWDQWANVDLVEWAEAAGLPRPPRWHGPSIEQYEAGLEGRRRPYGEPHE